MPSFAHDLNEEELLAMNHRRGVEDIFVDFKRKHATTASTDPQREQALGDRMKDILAFANTPRTRPAFLIVGVTDAREIVGIDAGWDDGELRNAFRGKASRAPIFRYYEVVLGSGERVGVFEIPPDQPRPLYLRTSCGKTREHVIYIRHGSTNASLEPDRWREVIEDPAIHTAAETTKLSHDIAELTARWLTLFEIHGVRHHQIPALLPNHHLPLTAAESQPDLE